jgi:hypothetical protein
MHLLQQMKLMADQFVARGEALGFYEFWLNRYQSLVASLIALAAALLATGLVWRQLAEARRQNLHTSSEHWRRRSVELDREVTLLMEITSGIDIFADTLAKYFENTSAQPVAMANQVALLQAAQQHMDAMIERFIREIGPLWGDENIQKARSSCRDEAQRFSVSAAEFIHTVVPGAAIVRDVGDALAEKIAPHKTAVFNSANIIHAGILRERTRAGAEINKLERKIFD